jgi:DNA ligase 1
MKTFANLYTVLDETNKTTAKVQALRDYFARVPPEDAAWAVYFLIGRRPRQVIPSAKLRAWAAEEARVPLWLFQESYDAVGDVAETIALLLPSPVHSSASSLNYWIKERLLVLRGQNEANQHEAIVQAWRELDYQQRFVWNKLISGAFRVGVSQQIVTRALSELAGIQPTIVAHRLMGEWEPSPYFFTQLLSQEPGETDVSRPYPFFLAHAIDEAVESLGARSQWQAEWKWDGIRSQLIRRDGQTFLWSRGEELVTERYPEIASVAHGLPDGTVIDGEILPWKNDQPLPFAHLQRRIGRKAVSRTILTQVPVILMAYDLLEYQGIDIRDWPLEKRRGILARLVQGHSTEFPPKVGQLCLSPIVESTSWSELRLLWATSRTVQAEGLMLKDCDSAYGVGRPRGKWWKWKVLPHTIDAVLTSAQRGSGKRASLYTDYTFGVWDNGTLVTIAKAYSGLTDAEIREVDSFVRRNMVEKFGPVRTVKPELVFELAFEGLNPSNRHKSGIAVRFPRILRWRKDKRAEEADTIDAVRALLPA